MQRKMAVEPSNLTGGRREGRVVLQALSRALREGAACSLHSLQRRRMAGLPERGSPPPLTPNTHTMAGPRLACLSVALGRHEWLQSDSAAYSATPYRSPPVGEESRGRSATPLTAMRQSQRNTERGDTHALLTSRTERAVLLELLRPVRPGAVLVPELRPGTAPGMLWPVRPGAVPEPLLLLMVEWHAAARCAFV